MPATSTLNGLNILEGAIFLPRIGVWHADLSLDSFASLSVRQVTLQFRGQSYSGVLTRAGHDFSKRLRARVVGGNAGLSTVLTPKSYGVVPLSIPLKDALNAAGEVLSPTSDPGLLSTQLTAWSAMAGPASGMLTSLLSVVQNAVWRVLIDGTVWVGFESWPAVTPDETILVNGQPEIGRFTIASDAPGLLPGTTFNYSSPGVGNVSKQVSYVQHIISPDAVRTTFYSE